MKIHILISGKVQGVFFRAYTKKKAEKLGLSGWVKNRDDGKVEAVFQGDKNQVDKMILWCRRGSPGAVVDRVEVVETVNKAETGFDGFEIRY